MSPVSGEFAIVFCTVVLAVATALSAFSWLMLENAKEHLERAISLLDNAKEIQDEVRQIRSEIA